MVDKTSLLALGAKLWIYTEVSNHFLPLQISPRNITRPILWHILCVLSYTSSFEIPCEKNTHQNSTLTYSVFSIKINDTKVVTVKSPYKNLYLKRPNKNPSKLGNAQHVFFQTELLFRLLFESSLDWRYDVHSPIM